MSEIRAKVAQCRDLDLDDDLKREKKLIEIGSSWKNKFGLSQRPPRP